MAGIATQQRPQTATMLKPISRNTLISIGKNEKLELFEDLLHTMLKMQPELAEAIKINQFDDNVQYMIDRLLHAKLPPHLKRSLKLAYLENDTNDQLVAYVDKNRTQWFGKRWGADNTHNDSRSPK